MQLFQCEIIYNNRHFWATLFSLKLGEGLSMALFVMLSACVEKRNGKKMMYLFMFREKRPTLHLQRKKSLKSVWLPYRMVNKYPLVVYSRSYMTGRPSHVSDTVMNLSVAIISHSTVTTALCHCSVSECSFYFNHNQRCDHWFFISSGEVNIYTMHSRQ